MSVLLSIFSTLGMVVAILFLLCLALILVACVVCIVVYAIRLIFG